MLNRDEAAFDSLQQLADTQLVDAQIHLVGLGPQRIVKALGQPDGDHPLRFGGVTFGRVLAPHCGNHFLQFSKLAAPLERPHRARRRDRGTGSPRRRQVL